MWMVDNQTPYAAERNWYLDKNAAKSWVVAVKAAFDVQPDGTCRLADDQPSPLYGPEYEGEPGSSCLRYEADLLGPKTRTDVLLNGHAYAPAGRPVRTLHVGMRVGSIRKQAVIFGDRYWQRGLAGLSMTDPVPFLKMPLVPERAFGGYDRRADDPAEHRLYPSNPIGTGFTAKDAHLDGSRLPNVECPDSLISSPGDRPRPAIFRAIASYWSPRLEYAGTYDERWMKTRMPLLAEDFDPRHYQVASEDQQAAGFLRGGESVQLINLTPGASLGFSLPRVRLAFSTRFCRERVEHRADLHTVVLEPDIPRVIMVWCTLLPCHHKVDKLDSTLVREIPFSDKGGADRG